MSPQIPLFFILSIIVFHHFPVANSRRRNLLTTRWCIVADLKVPDEQLQTNINWGCSVGGVDCKPIQPNGTCFEPDTLRNHASFVMNAYFQNHGRTVDACSFRGTGTISVTDPSYGGCVYPS